MIPKKSIYKPHGIPHTLLVPRVYQNFLHNSYSVPFDAQLMISYSEYQSLYYYDSLLSPRHPIVYVNQKTVLPVCILIPIILMTAKNIHMALAQTLGQTHFDAHKGNKIKRRNMIDTSLASTMYRGYYRSDDSTGCQVV